jgi:hypothetical protein
VVVVTGTALKQTTITPDQFIKTITTVIAAMLCQIKFITTIVDVCQQVHVGVIQVMAKLDAVVVLAVQLVLLAL